MYPNTLPEGDEAGGGEKDSPRMRHASHHPSLGLAPPLRHLVVGAARVRVPAAGLELDQLALLERALDRGRAAAGEVVEAGGAHFVGVEGGKGGSGKGVEGMGVEGKEGMGRGWGCGWGEGRVGVEGGGVGGLYSSSWEVVRMRVGRRFLFSRELGCLSVGGRIALFLLFAGVEGVKENEADRGSLRCQCRL